MFDNVRSNIGKGSYCFAVCTVLVLFGCSGNVPVEPEKLLTKFVVASDLAHHRWVLKTIDGEAVVANPLGAYGKGLTPELDFGEAHYVGGFAGCNQFNGEFELNELGQFRVANLATTMMLCPSEAMQLEQRYAFLLNQWSDIALDGNSLTLTQGEKMWQFSLFDWVQ